MTKCRWCEDRVPNGTFYCDDLCRKLYDNHASQQWIEGDGTRDRRKKKLPQRKNEKLKEDGPKPDADPPAEENAEPKADPGFSE